MTYLPGSIPGVQANHYLVADPAFQLSWHTMKPFGGDNLNYTQSIFNYRLSRARRVVENSFGIAASRFRVWRRPLEVQPAMAIAISQAVAVLHNFCMEKETTYNPPSSSDHIDHDGQLQLGSWRKDAVEMENTFYGLQAKSCNRTSDSARSLRERLATYLVGPGQVPWQLEMINGK